MNILLDANVLLRSVQPKHPDSIVSRNAVKHTRKIGYELCLVPQTIYEFWVVATRPVDVNGLGFSVARTQREIDTVLSLFRLRRDERSVFEHWRDLVENYDVKGKKAHDAHLVAAMKRHSIMRLLSFNDGDFRRYSGILVANPENVESLPVANEG